MGYRPLPCCCGFAAFLTLLLSSVAAEVVRETVFFDIPEHLITAPPPTPSAQLAAIPGYPADTGRLTLVALLYRPDPAVHGPGPYPAVIVLHGSGGMWSSDTVKQGPASQFQKWGTLLADLGYLALIPDSFNPRGIPGGFAGRRPHHDPAVDDAPCSPNYERPKDVIAALTYLNGRADLDRAHVGLLGFSHGAETGLNSILDASVDRGTYTVDYVNADGQSVKQPVSSPVRIPPTLPFPRVGIFYYPGCGLFSYHGSPNSVAAGRYMPDRRAQVIMYHGTADPLLGVTDPAATPKTGNLYPIKLVTASAAHAATQGIANPFAHHYLFDAVAHSFDGTDIEAAGNWNTPAESADERANRLAQAESLKWFNCRLRDHRISDVPDPDSPGGHALRWFGRSGLRYQPMSGATVANGWTAQGSPLSGGDAEITYPVALPAEQTVFYRLGIEPVPAPDHDPLYAGFFLRYSDFGY